MLCFCRHQTCSPGYPELLCHHPGESQPVQSLQKNLLGLDHPRGEGETCCKTPPDSISQGGNQWKGKSRHSKEMCAQWEGGRCHTRNASAIALLRLLTNVSEAKCCSFKYCYLQSWGLSKSPITKTVFLQEMRLLCLRSIN